MYRSGYQRAVSMYVHTCACAHVQLYVPVDGTRRQRAQLHYPLAERSGLRRERREGTRRRSPESTAVRERVRTSARKQLLFTHDKTFALLPPGWFMERHVTARGRKYTATRDDTSRLWVKNSISARPGSGGLPGAQGELEERANADRARLRPRGGGVTK